jgi:predicted alpha/beta-hydrolase family hydrolase
VKKIIKYGLVSVTALVIIGCAAFWIWSQQIYEPSKELNRLVNDVSYEEDWLIFQPTESKAVGVILYPGAKVNPEAYSYLGEQLADQGYFVGIPKVRFNLPMFEADKAWEMINKYPSIKTWYVGGHSLGGVAAASFAYENRQTVDGLILLASYPSNRTNFAQMDIPILSIFAEEDGLSTVEEIEEAESLLSNQTVLYEIKGGNHAQFGMYGPQKGDNKATMSVKEQQDLIIHVMNEWLSEQ